MSGCMNLQSDFAKARKVFVGRSLAGLIVNDTQPGYHDGRTPSHEPY
jgi:hypothetical protein